MPKIETGQTLAALASSLPELEQEKLNKLTEINGTFDAWASQITATYPQAELLTFDQQVTEARAYLADDKASCPMLQALSSARGVALDDLCQRVLAKHAAFSLATGHLMGQRQALEDQLDACTTPEQVRGIAVAFSLPA